MEFTVKVPGKRSFYCNIEDTQETRQGNETSRHAGEAEAKSPETPDCRLLKTVAPVIDYFSAITSHEIVEARYREDGRRRLLREPGQRVAFTLLVRSMLRSDCPFFGRFSFLLGRYRVGITHEMFLQMIRLAAPGKPAFRATPAAPPAPANGIEDHLWHLLDEARRRFVKDAAVNAVTIMFNLAMLAAESAGESPHALLSRLLPLAGGETGPAPLLATGA